MDGRIESVEKYSATIGFFDGVHRGHRYVIDRLRADADQHGLKSMVITFAQHPRQVLQKDFIPKLLSPADKKENMLAATGVDRVEVLDFTLELASFTAREFMQMMRDKLGVRRLLIGYDNRFGRNRQEGFEDYYNHGRELGIEVVCNDEYEVEGNSISSSLVRRLLYDGDVSAANDALGYEFGFGGVVVRGFGEGRKLGYPTANMRISQEQLIPKRGVYAVRVRIEGFEDEYLGMMNIGVRPTYGEFAETVEVNIFDFDADIYDKQMAVRFLSRIRDEKRFGSIDELKEQLAKDKEIIRYERRS